VSVEIDLTDARDLSAYFARAPEIARKSARLALNQVADRIGLKKARALMRKQVAFPQGYLEDPTRFRVKKFAHETDLEAVIAGRTEPTSLARFARFGATKSGAVVTVKPGRPRYMKRAFLIRLKNGNQGLALRLAPGEDLANRKLPAKRFGPGVVLLYGPSVDQVFRTVAEDVSPEALDKLSEEFIRQFVRLSRETA
jgi:hypothetical protein